MPTMTTFTYIRPSVGELVVDFFSSEVFKIPPNRTVPLQKNIIMSAFNRLTKHSKSGKIRFQIDPKHKTETSPEKLLKLPPLSSFLWPYHWHNTTRHPRPPPVLMVIFITICIGITNKIPVFVGSDVKSLQVFFRDSEARDANLVYNVNTLGLLFNFKIKDDRFQG